LTSKFPPVKQGSVEQYQAQASHLRQFFRTLIDIKAVFYQTQLNRQIRGDLPQGSGVVERVVFGEARYQFLFVCQPVHGLEIALLGISLEMITSRMSLRKKLALVSLIAGAFALSSSSASAQLQWDPTFIPATPSGGPGTWNTTTANWSNLSTDALWDSQIAVFGGTPGTGAVVLGSPVSATGLTFSQPGYTISGTSPNILTLTGGSAVVTTADAAISAIIAGSAGMNKSGAGTLTLSGVNTFTGGLNITAGTVSYAGADTNLGAAGVTLNGGTLTYTGVAYTASAARIITVGASGGTLNLAANVKMSMTTAGLFTGSGTLTRAGTVGNVANNLSITAANTGFTGGWIFTGGVTEVSGTNSLGNNSATNTLTLSGGELANNNNTIAQAITINSGILGGDNGTSIYSGPITVAGNFSVRLGDFYATTSRNLNISGPISGTGTISFLNGNGGAVSGQTLFLNGNNSGYTSNINVPAGYNVAFGLTTSLGSGTQTINTTATAMGGVGYAYDFGASIPVFTNTRTGTTGGVFGINTTLAATTVLDQSTLGGGGMWLGSQSTGSYTATTLTPVGGFYRLGGGGGTLTVTQAPLTGANSLEIGDGRTNGGGTVILNAQSSYTGTTKINSGTISVSSINSVTGGTATSTLGTPSSVANGTLVFGSTTFTGGLTYTGTGETTDRVLNLAGTTGGATITQSGTGPLIFNGAFNVTGVGTKTLTLSGSTAGTGEITQAVNNAALIITKSGTGTWTLSGTGNAAQQIVANGGVLNTGAGGITLNNGGGATITSSGSSTVNGKIVLGAAAGDFGASNGNTLTINADISGGANIGMDFYFNSATGTTVLNGNNTFSGPTSIQFQNLTVNSLNSVATSVPLGTVHTASSSLGSPTTVANGTIRIGGSAASSLKYLGTGETTDRVIDLAGGTAAFNATLDQSGTGLLKFVSPFTSTGAAAKSLILTGSTTGTGEVAAAIVDNSTTNFTTVNKSGTGTWTLSGTNTYTGETVLAAGILNVASLSNYGVASAIGSRPTGATETATPGLHFTGGTLQYTGSTAQSTDRAIRILNNTTSAIDASGSNPSATLSFTAASSPNLYDTAGARTFNLTGINQGNNVFAIALTDQNVSTGKTGLNKSGSGTWNLTGTSTYTGATAISGGLLRVSGTLGATATSIANVSSLGGTGTVNGAITAAAGGNINLFDGTAGTLTLGSTLTLNGTVALPNVLNFDMGGASATAIDKIAATGAVTVATAGGVIVNFNQLAGTPISDGAYTLISSTAASTLGNYTLSTSAAFGRTFAIGTTTANTPLVVNIGTAAAGPTSAVYSGATDVNWTTATNWNTDVSSATPAGAVPGVGTNVIFSTTTPAPTNLTTSLNTADFEINSLTFNGTAAVTIGGTKTLTIDASNTNGNVTGNGIDHSTSALTHTISSRIGLGASQTWTVGPASGTTAAALLVSGVVTDLGTNATLTKAGTGLLTLTNANNTFTGPINVTGGTLAFTGQGGSDATILGAGPKLITLTNNAVLRPTSSSNPTASSKFFVIGTGGGTFDTPSGVTFTIDDGNGTTALGAATGAPLLQGFGTLTKTGTGTLALGYSGQLAGTAGQGYSSFTGDIVIAAGTLQAGRESALGSNTIGKTTVASGGVLDFYSTATFSMAEDITINGNGTGAGSLINNSTSIVTLTGPLALGSAAGIGGTGTGGLTINSNITGAFPLTKFGSGTIKLTGTNSQSSTTLNAGVLNINAEAALGAVAPLAFTGTATLQFAAPVALPSTRTISVTTGAATFDTGLLASGTVTTLPAVISGAGGVTKSYVTQSTLTNPLVLSGVNTFTGNVTATSGWITATNSGSFGNGTKTISAVTNTSSASIHLDPGAGPSIDFPTTMTFNTSNDTFTGVNEGTIANDSGTNIIRGPVTLNSGGGGTIFASRAGSLTFTGNISATATGRLLKIRGDGDGVISGILSNGSTVDLPVQRDLGTGTWTLSGANTYSGLTTVASGTLKVGHASGLGAISSGTDNTTVVSGTGTVDLGGISNVTETFKLSGTGLGGNGALINTGAAVTLGGTVTGVYGTATGMSGAGTALTITGGDGTGFAAAASLGVTTATFAIAGGTTIYSAAPTVTITGGGGTGATATANLTAGVVSSITITALGSGFTTAPTIAFTAGTVTTAGTNPTGTGNATNFALSRINISNAGSNYTVAPTVQTTTGTPVTLTTNVAGVNLTGNSSIGGTGNITLNSAVTETGGARNLTKVGPNTLTLSAVNSYTGTTTVAAGMLVVNGSIASSSGTSIASGASLGGSGTTGPVTLVSGSTLSPGNSPGTLNTGSMTWVTGANYNWQATNLSSSTPSGSNFDSLVVGGTLDVQAGFNFNLWSLASTGPDVSGNAAGFSNAVDGFWKVASATSLTNGANLSSAVINVSAANGTAGFSNPLAGGSFSLVLGNAPGAGGTANDVYLKFSTLAVANPDIAVTSVATPDLFVLQNASLSSASSLVTLTSNSANTGTISSATYSNAVLTATTGQSIPASPGTMNSTISLNSTAANTTALGATATYVTTPGDSNTTNNAAAVNVRIGNAPLHATASSTNYGAALVAATPISVTPYTNLSSNTIGQTPTGTTVPVLGTTATIFNYTNSMGIDSGISMAWRSRTAAEASSKPSLGDNGTTGVGYLISDVVNLTGMDNGNGYTDTFILQMNYNEALLDGHEVAGVNHGNIVIAWKNNFGQWVNAVTGNSTPGGTYFANQAYNASARSLGDYGIDPTNNVVWAVLNHNSEFAVIPEPSTLVLGGLALLGFAGAGLRRRRMAKPQA
jgi:fibronectin-binding autotransporter adhesin